MSENVKAAPQVHNFKKPKSGNQDHSVHQVTVYQVACVIVLIIVALLFTFPLYWIITGSFKGPQAVNARVPVWFPTEPTLLNYEKLFEKPALMWMFNTVFVCALAMLFTCVAASMGGYALAKKRFTGRALIFSIFVCAMALPKQVILIPLLKEMAFLNLHNTLWAVILPTVGWPFGVFLMKQFSENIPTELLEAARIDGAGEVRIYLQLYLPVAKPLLATLGLFAALGYWNDWYNSMLFSTKQEMQSLQYFLQDMLSTIQALKQLVAEGQFEVTDTVSMPSTSMRMAMTCVVTGPIIFLYPLVQRYFVKGLTIGAVKG